MDNTTDSLAHNVNAARLKAGLSVNALALASGIPYATLTRKLDGIGEFKPTELFRLAQVLQVSTASLFPNDFFHEPMALAAEAGAR